MPALGAVEAKEILCQQLPFGKRVQRSLAKTRVLKFLHQVMGFHVLAWESSLYSRRKADHYLRSGGGAKEALELGDRMYVLAVTAYGGLHGRDTWIGYPYHLERDQVDELELEELLEAVGHEYGFVNLRPLRAPQGALSLPLIARGIDLYIPWRADWPESLDGLLFMRQMTPSTTRGGVDGLRPSSH